MRKVITSIALLLTACLNVQCQKAEVHTRSMVSTGWSRHGHQDTLAARGHHLHRPDPQQVCLSSHPPLASAMRHHRHSRLLQCRPHCRGLRHLRLRTDSRRDAAHPLGIPKGDACL